MSLIVDSIDITSNGHNVLFSFFKVNISYKEIEPYKNEEKFIIEFGNIKFKTYTITDTINVINNIFNILQFVEQNKDNYASNNYN